MNIYEQILERAKERERTHHERRFQQHVDWVKAHPECAYACIGVTDDGVTIRDWSKPADMELWRGAGWFDRVVKKKKAKAVSADQMSLFDDACYGQADDGVFYNIEGGGTRDINPVLKAWVADLRKAYAPVPEAKKPATLPLPLAWKGENALML